MKKELFSKPILQGTEQLPKNLSKEIQKKYKGKSLQLKKFIKKD